MARLHEADNPQGDLSRRRPAYYWQYLVHSKGIGTCSVVGTGSGLAGYFHVQGGERTVRCAVPGSGSVRCRRNESNHDSTMSFDRLLESE